MKGVKATAIADGAKGLIRLIEVSTSAFVVLIERISKKSFEYKLIFLFLMWFGFFFAITKFFSIECHGC